MVRTFAFSCIVSLIACAPTIESEISAAAGPGGAAGASKTTGGAGAGGAGGASGHGGAGTGGGDLTSTSGSGGAGGGCESSVVELQIGDAPYQLSEVCPMSAAAMMTPYADGYLILGSAFDGTLVIEACHHDTPDHLALSSVAPSDGLSAPVSITFTDDYGRRWASRPSKPGTVTVKSLGSVGSLIVGAFEGTVDSLSGGETRAVTATFRVCHVMDQYVVAPPP